MPTHDTGVWLDDDGNVTYEQPEGRSTQLVAPGGEVSTAVRSRIEAYGLNDVTLPTEEETADAPPAEDDDKTVTTEAAKPAAKRTRKATKKS